MNLNKLQELVGWSILILMALLAAIIYSVYLYESISGTSIETDNHSICKDRDGSVINGVTCTKEITCSNLGLILPKCKEKLK